MAREGLQTFLECKSMIKYVLGATAGAVIGGIVGYLGKRAGSE